MPLLSDVVNRDCQGIHTFLENHSDALRGLAAFTFHCVQISIQIKKINGTSIDIARLL